MPSIMSSLIHGLLSYAVTSYHHIYIAPLFTFPHQGSGVGGWNTAPFSNQVRTVHVHSRRPGFRRSGDTALCKSSFLSPLCELQAVSESVYYLFLLNPPQQLLFQISYRCQKYLHHHHYYSLYCTPALSFPDWPGEQLLTCKSTGLTSIAPTV